MEKTSYSSDTVLKFFLYVVIIICTHILMGINSMNLQKKLMNDELIKLNIKHYNSQTGKIEYVNPEYNNIINKQ
jgi:hypothetical protein